MSNTIITQVAVYREGAFVKRKGKISLFTSCTHSIKDPPQIASKHRQGESGKKRDQVGKEFVS